MDIQFLYEDNHLLIINKPFGELVHSDKTGDTPLEDYLKSYIKNTYGKPGNVFLRACHRLDRPVSGALIYGKTSKGLERMTGLFREKMVQKTYWALAERVPAKTEGRVSHFLEKDRAKNVVRAFPKDGPNRKQAITTYKVIGRFDSGYLFELKPVTGRSHQLRVMMAGMKCPILGDLKYGGKKISNGRAILLHARSIAFMHPVQQKMLNISAPLPSLSEWKHIQDFTIEAE